MKRTIIAILVLGCICFSHSVSACPDGQLRFAFSNLEVRQAFALLADFAGLKPNIDLSLTQSEPMNFECTPWRVVAQRLADRHGLSLRIENGTMHVTRVQSGS